MRIASIVLAVAWLTFVATVQAATAPAAHGTAVEVSTGETLAAARPDQPDAVHDGAAPSREIAQADRGGDEGTGEAVREAPEQQVVAHTDEDVAEEDEALPFGATIELSHLLGIGTFLSDEFSRRPQYDIELDFRPYYRVADGHTLSLRLLVTKNVVANADSPLTAEGQTLLSDLFFQYRYRVFEHGPSGLMLTAGPDIVAPTALDSQLRTKVLGLRANAILSGQWDWFSVDYWFRFTKNFHRYTHAAVENASSIPICINRVSISPDLCFPGGKANIEFSFLNALTLGFQATEALSFEVNFLIVNALTYDVNPDDAFRSPNADAGRGQRDLMHGSVYARYAINDYLTVEFGVVTEQEPKTPDNKSFRFPFFNPIADNLTVFDLGVIGTF